MFFFRFDEKIEWVIFKEAVKNRNDRYAFYFKVENSNDFHGDYKFYPPDHGSALLNSPEHGSVTAPTLGKVSRGLPVQEAFTFARNC